MILAQLTDLHIKAGRHLAYGRVDTADFLARAIDHLNALRPAVDAVLLSGDLTDGGTPEDSSALRDLLGALRAPWLAVPGNHDDRASLRATFPEGIDRRAAPGPFLLVVEDRFPLRLIGLDTTVPGQPHGHLCAERLAWLDARLAEAPAKPTLIFQHHPPFETGLCHMDVQNLRTADALFEVLARHPQVRHVACGHVHRAVETTIRGIGVSIAPSPAHAVTLDFHPDAAPSFTMDPPMIRLFRLDPAGLLTSHLSAVGRFDGPHPFFAPDGGLIG
ncbi:phosphodiesterase [uncultured Rhodospira sp.]|mgnify:CR=1 FL=1|uniref:phosphodiesterase n=1 Tax=uncultured Rhodospira sp. TaxID=1936189 RepID=UPI00261B4864|nr:phosphodiesterase [uncultured Rhodospira sp.]